MKPVKETACPSNVEYHDELISQLSKLELAWNF